MTSKYEHGAQPLDELLDSLGLSNDDLVKASTLQLTHKQVQKARKGRRVTPNIQNKILLALNDSIKKNKYLLKDLFSY